MDEEIVEAPSLDALREIRVPEAVSMAPQTTGWWVLLGLLALALVLLALWWIRRWRHDRYRRDALARLEGIELAELPVLVKRVALDAWPRTTVAELSGDPWLAFLDASLGSGTAFSEGPGRLLPGLAYGGVAPTEAETRSLVDLVRTWIRKHRNRV